MPRITLVDPKDRPDLTELVAKISGARGGLLINIYRTLLNSPALTDAWLNFLSTLRSKTQMDKQTQEIAILRVGYVNRAEYIVRQHATGYALQAGLTKEQVAAIADWEKSKLFSERERALLAYVDAMTIDLDVSDDVFAAVRAHYSEQQIVEITAMVGAYNMHSRVCKALRIELEPAPTQS